MAVQWHSLPDECWQVILACVPLLERIQCSCASTKLHKAAVAATDQIHVQQAPKHVAGSMLRWIQKHGQQITSLRVLSGLGFAMTRLACPNPQELQLEHVDVQLGSSMQSPGVLTVCTALTKLQIRYCSVMDAHSGLGVLAWVPALQHLDLTGLQLEDGQSAHLPPFVLQHLTNLTFLSVSTSSNCEDSLEYISCLTGLQELSWSSCAARPMLSPSTSPGFCQLTALTSISIAANCLDPAVLLSCTQLQQLIVQDSKHSLDQDQGVMASAGAGGALLSCIARMPQLQQLRIQANLWQWPQDAAAYTSLMASSNLTGLSLTGCGLPDGVWDVVFPTERCWPHCRLQVFAAPLVVRTTIVDDDGEEDQNWPVVPTSAMSQAAIGQLVSCCPMLRQCSLCVDLVVNLSPLMQLGGLTKLHAENVGVAAYRSLGNLRGLEHLFVKLGTEIPAEEALALTDLVRLTYVKVSGQAVWDWEDCETVCVEFISRLGNKPVSSQLLEHCGYDSKCQAVMLRQLSERTAFQGVRLFQQDMLIQQLSQQSQQHLGINQHLLQQQQRMEQAMHQLVQQQQQQPTAQQLPPPAGAAAGSGGPHQQAEEQHQQQQVEQHGLPGQLLLQLLCVLLLLSCILMYRR